MWYNNRNKNFLRENFADEKGIYMKRKIFLAMTTVISALFLASCSCDGCAGNPKVSFKDYYWKDADYAVTEVNETLSYAVTHSGNNSYNDYTVHYSDGVYEMHLQKTGEDVYTLETNFSIGVSFEYGGVSTEVFQDSTSSTTTFYSAKNMLRPISSTKTVVSHSPAQNAPEKLEDCYTLYNQTVTTVYDGAKGTTTVVNNENQKSITTNFEFEDTDKYAYLDNEQLLFALRCMNPSATGKVQIYSPYANAVQVISTAFGSNVSGNFNLKLNGATESQAYQVSYTPVTLEIDAKLNGNTQTVWIAKTTDTNNNTYRNVMLKYVAPLPLTLGEFTYNLVSATFAN